MATSQKQTTDALRTEWTTNLMEHIRNCDTDVCQTAAGTFMFPVVDKDGEDRWIKISIIIPKDAEEENGTDGYSLAREYQLKVEAAAARKEKAEKEAAERAAKHAKKTKSENSVEKI